MKNYVCKKCGSKMEVSKFSDCTKALCTKCNCQIYIPENPKFFSQIVNKGQTP